MSNIVDVLCEKLDLHEPGKYSRFAKAFGVTRQVVNGWKTRDMLPRDYCPQASRLTGIPVLDLLLWKKKARATRQLPMNQFLADVTRHLEFVRRGNALDLTVNAEVVVRLSPNREPVDAAPV